MFDIIIKKVIWGYYMLFYYIILFNAQHVIFVSVFVVH